jgi:hypothetical protein
MLHVHPLLGNVLVNKFPRRQILGKQSVAGVRNNVTSCGFRVCGDVTIIDSDHMICFFLLDPTDAPIRWLKSDHMICVYYRSMSVLPEYK